MATEDEGGVSLEISDPETQFVPQEDDAETLWEVLEITGEKDNLYKVKWGGIDPDTKRPWKQSWVHRRDCTPDIVHEWKRKQALKKKNAERRKSAKRESNAVKKSRASVAAASNATSKGSTASSSTIKRDSRSSVTLVTTDPKPSSSTAVPEGPEPAPTKRKRASVSSSLGPPETSAFMSTYDQPPMKKRKVHEKEDEYDYEVSNTNYLNKGKQKETAEGEGVDVESKEDPKPQHPKKKRKGHLEEDDRSKGSINKGKQREISKVGEEGTDVESTDTAKPQRASSRSVANKKSTSTAGRNSSTGSSKPYATKRASAPHPSTLPVKPKTTNPLSSIRDASDIELSDAELPTRGRPQSMTPSAELNSPQPVKTFILSTMTPVLSPAALARLELFDAISIPALNINDGNDMDLEYPPTPHDQEPYEYTHDDDNEPEPDLGQLLTPHSPLASPQPVPVPAPHPIQPTKSNPFALPSDGDDSYRNEIVPETETQSSTNTQAQAQSHPSSSPHSVTLRKSNAPRSESGSRSSKAPSRASSKAPAQPRIEVRAVGLSPRQNKQNSAVAAKELRPIPVVSPSRFTPHLPSSLIPAAGDDSVDREMEDLVSSIEQFSSPEKGGKKKMGRGWKGKDRDVGISLSEPDIDEDFGGRNGLSERDVMQRGQEMADMARRVRVRLENGEELPQPKKRLTDLLNAKERQKEKKKKGKEKRGVSTFKSLGLQRNRLGLRYHERLERVVEPASTEAPNINAGNPEGELGTGMAVVQEMENVYVDLTGGTLKESNTGHDTDSGDEDESEEKKRKRMAMLLREEEEESTQDLMNELHGQGMAQGLDKVLSASPPQGNQDMIVDGDAIEISSRGASPVHSVTEQDQQEKGDEAQEATPIEEPVVESRPPSKSKPSSTSGHAQAAGEEDTELTPITSSHHSTPMQESTTHQEAIPEHEPHHSDATMLLLNAKSEEISRLDATLMAAQAKTEEQAKEIVAVVALLDAKDAEAARLGEVIAAEQAKNHELEKRLDDTMALLNQQSEEASRMNGMLIEEREKNEGMAKEIAELKEAFDRALSMPHPRESEIVGDTRQAEERLVDECAALLQSKLSAEKDREFFREQYAQASGYVTSVREENAELEKRVEIAEGQAKNGVAMVRATFEARVKTLEDDAKTWKRTAVFLMEKDKRTDDEIRRRAAEHPELDARCRDLEDTLETLMDQTRTLEAEKEEVNAMLAAEMTEKRDISKALEEANAKLDEMEARNAHEKELVYRCQWRQNNEPCEAVFLSIEDLENHFYTGGHLQD